MHISRRLQVVTYVPALLAVVMIAFVAYANTAVLENRRRQDDAAGIFRAVTDLSALASMYAAQHEVRPVQQFDLVIDHAHQLVARAWEEMPEQRRRLEGVSRDTEAMGELIGHMVSNHRRRLDTPGDHLLAESDQLLLGQIRLHSYRVANSAEEILDQMQLDAWRRQQVANYLFLAAVLAGVAVILPLLHRLRKSVVSELEDIRRGTEIVRRGNLRHRIGPYRNAELDHLAGAFNAMTAGLEETTVSVNRLEEEIHERVRVQEELESSEEKFRNIFKTSAGLITISAFRDGRYIDVNDAFTEITGYAREDVLGRSILEVNVWADLDARDRLARRLKAEGKLHNEEIRLRTKSGELKTALMSAAFMELEGESCIIGSATDITERKRAEDALQRSLTQFTAVFNQMTEGLMLFSPDGVLLDMNPAAMALHGVDGLGSYQRHIVELADTFTLYDLQDRRLPVDEWPASRALRGERFDNHEVCVRRTDTGKSFIGSFSGSLVHDPDGQPMLAIASVRDVTAQREAEQALRQMNEQLERQVADRTAQLEARSRQLQAMSVELIESEEQERRRFAELLHDDLQQVLAAAKLQLQWIAEHQSPEQIASVERLLDESIRKSRNLSHELSPSVLHHSGLMAALKWLSRRMGEQFGLEVRLEGGLERQAKSDPVNIFIFRAVQELLFNVVKHAGVKHAHVAVAGSNGTVTVTVSDCGRGFVPDRANASTSAGLGLLSLRERASYIGGRMIVESDPGSGSRFTIVVPEHATPPVGPGFKRGQTDPGIAAADHPVRTAGRGTRVLLADDHKVMRKGLRTLLSGQPVLTVVGEASNGREAYEQALRLKPDVVVMDVTMPIMDGIEATRLIKAEVPQMRIIGLSMHQDEELARAMCDAGAEAFIGKAESTARLLKAIFGTAAGTPPPTG